jgi:limonene-1,2-epoxide hydrolase
MTNTEIVEAFIRAWEEKSIDGILGHMTPDARYVNVGLSEAVGQSRSARASRRSWRRRRG